MMLTPTTLQMIGAALFGVAVLHTFSVKYFERLAHTQPRHAGFWHLLGEVEVVFGFWAAVLMLFMFGVAGRHEAVTYLESRDFTEPMFVFAIMVVAGSRPILDLANLLVRTGARLLPLPRPMALCFVVLSLVPLLGAFITEPAAMTLAALLLRDGVFARDTGPRLKYAILGVLFVNVSIGGTLTPFAAPPVLMVARPWGWTSAFMAVNFGWRACLAIVMSTAIYYVLFRRELRALAARPGDAGAEQADEESEAGTLLPVPAWMVGVHLAFMAWTVFNSHDPVLFVGGFLFFLGFARATTAYQSRVELRSPLLVGFFLAGLVIHGGLQGWWIAPVLGRLSNAPLFLGSTLLTAFNDNALITYLATLVPSFTDPSKLAVVGGAVVGGGLTVVANAPNPAGQAILSPFFDRAILPIGLFAGALLPTAIAALAFFL